IPTLLFVNKLDRRGADPERVLVEIRNKLTPAAISIEAADAAVDVLAENDEALLAAYVEGASVPLGKALAAQTKRALVYPVFVGSARTGAGVGSLMAGLVELLPADVGDSEGLVSAAVFKIERGPAGEKIAYVRMFSGTVHARDRLRYGGDEEEKVT